MSKTWKEVSLGEILKIERGGSPRPITSYLTDSEDGINWIKIGDTKEVTKYIYKTQEKIKPEGITKSRVVHSGDFILSNSMSFGKPYIMRTTGCIHDGWLVLRKKEDNINEDFLYYLLGSNLIYQQFSRLASGSTVKNLNINLVKKVKIPLPSIEEQKRIAEILDRADEIRQKRKRAIALTEQLARSTFLDMFGNPVTNPKGWEVGELQQVCKRVTDGTHQSPDWVKEGIPFLFVSNIVNGEIDFNVSKYISESSWKSLTENCPIEQNDILYTSVGSYGNAALVETEKKFCFQRHIAHIKPDVAQVYPEFLLGLMQSDGIKQQADRQVRGVAQKTLNLRELKKFRVIIPPLEEQELYVRVRKSFKKLLKKQKNSFDYENNLFNSLLQRAFKGEL